MDVKFRRDNETGKVYALLMSISRYMRGPHCKVYQRGSPVGYADFAFSVGTSRAATLEEYIGLWREMELNGYEKLNIK